MTCVPALGPGDCWADSWSAAHWTALGIAFGLGAAAGSAHCFIHRIGVFTLKYLECYLKSSSNSATFALSSGLGF